MFLLSMVAAVARHVRGPRFSLLCSLVCLLALGAPSLASGAVRPNTETTPAPHVQFDASEVTADGDVVVLGAAGPFKKGITEPCLDAAPSFECSDARPIVARFDSDGQLDRTFADGRGYVLLNPFDVAFDPQVITYGAGVPGDIAVAPNGDIVVLIPGIEQAQLQRLTASGQPMQTFGVNGRVAIPKSLSIAATADKIGVDLAGRVLIAGTVDRAQFAVQRLLPDGSPDPTFGVDGLATVAPDPGGSYARGQVLAVRPGGRPLVVGEAVEASGDAELAAAQFDPSGSPDPGFSGDGVAQIPIPNPGSGLDTAHYIAHAVALDEAGSAVVWLERDPVSLPLHFSCGHTSALRLAADGALDSGFGDGGFAPLDSFNCARDLTLLETGGIFGVGRRQDYAPRAA